MTPSGEGDEAGEVPVLVIKLGALGDFLQALGPFAAIRRHHPNAAITLLTTAPYAEMAERCGYFDQIWLDDRPKFLQIRAWTHLRNRLRSEGFARVYDLQTSDRSGFYFRLFFPGPYPQWSGIASRASHPHANPRRNFQHSIERQAEQLHMAGIPDVPAANIDWMTADVSQLQPPSPYALLVPGGAPHRPEKRWPASHYGELAQQLVGRGITPVLLGTRAEAETLSTIQNAAPEAVNLMGATNLFEIAALARHAVAAIGNDTGPMHLIAITGTLSVVLFSQASNPALCAPRGRRVTILREPALATLTPDAVLDALHLGEGSALP
ncbi:MAG: ADP-heptose--LPS heptosyltransferase [Rhodospirillaceae bacterium]|nr:MAG: ADP-heptose--LPS heptosyltransferase [Rhodospirillaceae bacterium]